MAYHIVLFMLIKTHFYVFRFIKIVYHFLFYFSYSLVILNSINNFAVKICSQLTFFFGFFTILNLDGHSSLVAIPNRHDYF